MKHFLFLIVAIGAFIVLAFLLQDHVPDLAPSVGPILRISSSASSDGENRPANAGAGTERARVAVVEPLNNAIDVPLESTVRIRFGEPMHRSSVQSAIDTDFAYFLHWTDDTEVVLYPVGLQRRTRYGLSIGAEAKTADGVALRRRTVSHFTTGDETQEPGEAAIGLLDGSAIAGIRATGAREWPVWSPLPASNVSNSRPTETIDDTAVMQESTSVSSISSNISVSSVHKLPAPIAPAPSQPPVIEGIDVTVLTFDDRGPVRARASVRVRDPEGSPVDVSWSVQCGGIVGPASHTYDIDWYAERGCRSMGVTVRARNAHGASTVYTQNGW